MCPICGVWIAAWMYGVRSESMGDKSHFWLNWRTIMFTTADSLHFWKKLKGHSLRAASLSTCQSFLLLVGMISSQKAWQQLEALVILGRDESSTSNWAAASAESSLLSNVSRRKRLIASAGLRVSEEGAAEAAAFTASLLSSSTESSCLTTASWHPMRILSKMPFWLIGSRTSQQYVVAAEKSPDCRLSASFNPSLWQQGPCFFFFIFTWQLLWLSWQNVYNLNSSDATWRLVY